jgi:hypothetical protein
MALLTDFFIEAVAGNEPCTIQINDITPYPWGPFDYNQIATVMFYDDANFAGPTYTGGQLGNLNQYGLPGSWTIGSVPDGLYYIRVFVVTVWTVPLGTYPLNSVVFYNGQFWHANNVGGTAQTPDRLSVDWDMILVGTPANIATAFGYFMGDALAAPGKAGYVNDTYQVDCQANYSPTLTKMSCYHYTFEDISGLGYTQTINVYAYGSSTVLATYTLDPAVATTVDIDITTWGDGVYTIVVTVDTGASEYELVYRIYEWCALWSCYQRLLQAVMCGQYNPCCNTCDPALIETNRRYREALNMMQAFVLSIWAYTNVEQVKYLGIFGNSDEQDAYVSRVADMIAEAKAISQACGVCNPTSEEGSVDSPCANCN